MSCTSYTISNRFGFHFNSISSIAFVVLHRDQHPTIPKHPIIPPNSTIQTIPPLSPSTPWYLRIPGDKVCSGIGIVRGFDGLDLTLWLLKHVLQAEENMSFLRGLVKACTKRIQHYIIYVINEYRPPKTNIAMEAKDGATCSSYNGRLGFLTLG